jgi:hypothetical protein
MYYLLCNLAQITARGYLQRLMPKEIQIVKYLLTIEDPEVRLCALKDAFIVTLQSHIEKRWIAHIARVNSL